MTTVGRKPQPVDVPKRNVRYIKCPNCKDCFEYDYKNPEFRRDRKVARDLSPKSKTREYNRIHREKVKNVKTECLLE